MENKAKIRIFTISMFMLFAPCCATKAEPTDTAINKANSISSGLILNICNGNGEIMMNKIPALQCYNKHLVSINTISSATTTIANMLKLNGIYYYVFQTYTQTPFTTTTHTTHNADIKVLKEAHNGRLPRLDTLHKSSIHSFTRFAWSKDNVRHITVSVKFIGTDKEDKTDIKIVTEGRFVPLSK